MTDGAASRAVPGGPPDHPTFREAVGVWARVAALSFGGPAGQIAVMHRILVEERRWIGEKRFLHALNYCMLLPGPEAQQLATYVGWMLHGVPGGLLAGGLFILPGAVAIMALSIVYALFGSVGWVAALFFGLKAAVLAVVVQAVARLAGRALPSRLLKGIAAAAFVAIFLFHVPFPLIVVAAAAMGYASTGPGRQAGRPVPAGPAAERTHLLSDEVPDAGATDAASARRAAAAFLALWLLPVAALLVVLGPSDTFTAIAVFFSKMAMVTFGGAYAALAYVAQQAVETFHWLAPGEMLDGLGMAETTPGPLIMVLQFVGFMAAFRDPGGLPPVLGGILGGLLATWVTFAPCFLWIFAGAPYVETLRGHARLTGALSAITAAVVGVILNLAVWFAIHALFRQTVPVRAFGTAFDAPVPGSVEPAAVALAAAAMLALFRFRVGMVPTLGACALAGLALHGLGGGP